MRILLSITKHLFSVVMVSFMGLTLSCVKTGGNDSSSNAPTGPHVLACSTSVVDIGQKGSVVGVARGVYSDTKIIPGTSSPVTAFSDPTAVAMKISYYNGTQFLTEVISGDGGGAFVRLVFTPTGVPLVFWTLGVNLKVAIRSSSFASTGTWNAGIIDTGTAPRAVEASVNPLGQVLVSFLTDTAVTGRPKILFCNSNCTSPASFQTMSPNPYVENTNLNAGETATGAGWCQVSANSYYPAITYSVTGVTKYAVCRSALSNCALSTNWTTQSIVATSNLSTKLLLDSSIVGDVPKVVSLGASGISPYKMGSTSCTLAPTAFTAGSAMGTATSGTQWMSFLKDSLGKFHLVANESTTSVKYFNSTSNDPTASWNAAGIIETTTLAAASGGGADLDNSTRGVYASYALNAVPYDLHIGRTTDDSVASNLATFTHLTPDLSGNLQLGTAGSQLKNIAAASNNELVPAVAYVDFSVGAAASAKLKFSLRAGSTSTSLWSSHLIPGTINPQFPSLAFDQNDKPWIAYFEAGTNKYFLVTNSMTDGSGNWSGYEFPAPSSGAPIALPAANNTALTMINIGGVKRPLLAIIDNNATSKGVKAVYFDTVSRVWSPVTVIDPLTSGALGAAHLSIDADANSNAVIAYQDLSLIRVRYAETNGGISWSIPLTISSINQGPGVSIKINPSTGSPAVAYFDQINNAVYYSSCNTSIAGCQVGGWNPTPIEGAAGVSGLSAATGQLLSASLTFDPFGNPLVAYPRGQTNDGNFLLWNNEDGSFNSIVEATGANGNLVGTPALNFAVAGWGISSTVNAATGTTSLYIGPGNWLYATSCGD